MLLKKGYSTLRLILGDQLNSRHSWFESQDSSVLYLIAELRQEATYAKHHVQKLCAFFLAMQNFSQHLIDRGHHVLHLTLDDTKTDADIESLITRIAHHYSVNEFQYQRPDEFRLLEQLENLHFDQAICVQQFDTEHFYLDFGELSLQIKPERHNRMEAFYRKMRKRFQILMNGSEPLGGSWNFDSENRHKLKSRDLETIPNPLVFENDIASILDRIQAHQIDSIGSTDGTLLWPTNLQQAHALLEFFCEHCLVHFGKFQDAMTCSTSNQWSLYHSRLSFALNTKILAPETVINKAIKTFNQSKGEITLPQIEGFIRQILGWREYVRAVYWVNMPRYQSLNKLNAKRHLPSYFWGGQTKMNCMSHCISQSLEKAYAHHIQRLMITGNFCLLAGIDPSEVDEWYLGIYIDAIEWVEMPNTRGMSQFADGGFVATKPYCSSGNYINNMSDYCKSCHYDIKDRDSENSCPFNALYWTFIDTHQSLFSENPRMRMINKSWQKLEQEKKAAILARGQWCLDNLDSL
jgi:deoxyribodipyrimidine photolyase-related protein